MKISFLRGHINLIEIVPNCYFKRDFWKMSKIPEFLISIWIDCSQIVLVLGIHYIPRYDYGQCQQPFFSCMQIWLNFKTWVVCYRSSKPPSSCSCNCRTKIIKVTFSYLFADVETLDKLGNPLAYTSLTNNHSRKASVHRPFRPKPVHSMKAMYCSK